MSKYKRQLQRDEAFLDIAKIIATLSTTKSRKVGAVLVKNNRILSTGYNGTPKGIDIKCQRCESNIKSGTELNKCSCVHAEINAIIQAAYFGVSSNGATIYCTTHPCLDCLKAMINAGIKTVYYLEKYNTEYPKEFNKVIEIIKFLK